MDRLLYNIVLHAVAAPLMAIYYSPSVLFRGKYRNSLRGKLGLLPEDFHPESLPRPRVWFHAVSVGEVVALGPILTVMKELVPEASLIVSTGTETGQARARETIPHAAGFLYLPLDFPAFVDRVVSRIRPDLFVLMETELWPNLIHSLKVHAASIALANGRISDRSFPRYRKLRVLFEPTLGKMDLFLMTSQSDAERIAEMGAPQDRIHVTGNTKFDAALAHVPSGGAADVRERFDIPPTARVLVAGSTHPGEHEIVLDAFNDLKDEFPDLILILVPRHVEKTPLVLSALKTRGMDEPFLRSSLDLGEQRHGRRVIIVDRTGELFQIYSVASVVFVGGSLVPRGGQNILEPAAWGRMVLFGPSTEDFREARDLMVRVGAGAEVGGREDLTRRIRSILADPENAARLGALGRQEILKHVGSARSNAELLASLVPMRGQRSDIG